MRNTKLKNFAIFGTCAVFLIALDQLLKIWAIANLQGQTEIALIQGFLHLTYLENTGAAFGLLAGFGGAQLLLTIVKVIITLLAILYFAILPGERRFLLIKVPILLVVSGGIGNLIDRIRFGHVVDMLAFRFIDFPIFNIADIYVTTGVVMFGLMALFVVKDAPLFGTAPEEKP